MGCLIELAEMLIITLVIFFGIQTFIAQPYKVEQWSMEPTFEPKDYVLVDKVTPRLNGYARGDVVVFQPNIRTTCDGEVERVEGPEPYIKRVIGKPGELVELRDGKVWINGAALDEPYVHGASTDPESGDSSWVVPAGALFVMGDNRERSSDSRSFGPICQRDVIGRGFLRYWPLSAFTLVQGPQYGPIPSPAASP